MTLAEKSVDGREGQIPHHDEASSVPEDDNSEADAAEDTVRGNAAASKEKEAEDARTDHHNKQQPVTDGTTNPREDGGAGDLHSAAHGHPHQHHHHSSNSNAHDGPVPFYAPPRQRQRWGDTQVAPHTNWGDLFFDLFYVAAAYNLGSVLRGDPTAAGGLLYTAGLFFPIANLWAFKTYYDSRFYYADDYWHRGYEIALLLALATAVLHIRPVSVLSHPAAKPDMFVFCLGICAAFALAVGRLGEIVLCRAFLKRHPTGLHPEALVACRRDALGNLASGGFFIAAAVYAGTQFYGSGATADPLYHRDLSDASTTITPTYKSSTSNAELQVSGYHHARYLATAPEAAATLTPSSATTSSDPDNIAIWLLLGGTFAAVAWFALLVVYFSFRKENHRQSTVPMNVNFAIRRYGEWTMLMLGETVLSLLIVSVVDTTGYYQTFVCGITSIILLQYLHFQSQPSDPDQHAMRRSLPSSFAFYWLMQIYSLSLIILGTCYKMLLFEFVYMEEEAGNNGSSHRRSLFLSLPLFHGLDRRWLAAGGASAALRFSAADRQERIAHFFSGSLATIFFCLDAMSLAHRGLGVQWHRCECAGTPTKKLLAFSLVACRTALILFAATLSQFETDPNNLATIGLFVILAQLCVRFVGFYVFDANEDYVEDQAIERTINYNAARMHDRPGYSDTISHH